MPPCQLIVASTHCHQRRKKNKKNSLQKTSDYIESIILIPYMPVDSFSLERRTESFNQYRTIEIWTNGQYPTNIPFPSSMTSFMTSQDTASSQSSTSNGDTTIFISKREMNGRPCSKQVKDYLNQQWCSLASQTHWPPSKQWWMTSSVKK